MTIHSERGLKGVELGMGLLMLGILAALAIPLLSKISSQVTTVAAAVEERAATAAEFGTEEAVVAGVQIDRSTDGATCRWTLAAGGTVYGVWEQGATTLYGRFDARPEGCPTAAAAAGAGFATSFVGP